MEMVAKEAVNLGQRAKCSIKQIYNP